MKRSTLGYLLVLIGLIAIIYMAGANGKNLFDGALSAVFKKVNIEQAVDVSAVNKVVIETGSINVHVQQGSGSQAVVHLQGHSGRSFDDIGIKVNGDTLEIKPNWKKRFILSFSNVKLNVQLPEKLWDELEVETGSGNIVIDNINSDEIELDASSGNITASKLKANDLSVKASSGQLKLSQLESGSASLKTSSGNIRLEDYMFDKLSANASSGNIKLIDGQAELDGKTSSGNISVDSAELMHDMTLQASSGNIEVIVDQTPQSLAVDYRGGSGRGRIQKDGFVYEDDDHDRIVGTFGNGEVKLKARTSSGNFTLK